MVAFVCNVKCLCGHVSKASTCCEHVGGFFFNCSNYCVEKVTKYLASCQEIKMNPLSGHCFRF